MGFHFVPLHMNLIKVFLCCEEVIPNFIWKHTKGIFFTFVMYSYTLCMAMTSMGQEPVSNSMIGYDV